MKVFGDKQQINTGDKKKYMSMIRKYHNYKLQTNPRHHEEELQGIYSNKTSKRQKKANLLITLRYNIDYMLIILILSTSLITHLGIPFHNFQFMRNQIIIFKIGFI